MQVLTMRCTAEKHGLSKSAWDRGCRCPGAVAGYEEFKAKKAAARAIARQRGGSACGAIKHGTKYAYEEFGCRCPEARKARRLSQGVRLPKIWSRWNQWRGPKNRVSRTNLMLLLAGVKDSPTPAEMMVADIRLQRLRVVDGPRHSRPLTTQEISDRLDCGEQVIYRVRKRRRAYAAQRTQRRLADVQWKAVRAQKAGARKVRVAAQHAAAHARREHAAAAWTIRHNRLMRRLRESQERAKRVAIAIERRMA